MSKELPFDPLDPQRDLVYRAECIVFPRNKDVLLPLAELQAEADRLVGLAWFKRAAPGITHIVVKDGRGAKWARNYLGDRKGEGIVQLPKKTRVPDVLHHEAVHQALPRGMEWHGLVFCGMLLYFVGKLYGKVKKDHLRRAFKRQVPPVRWDRRVARFGDLMRTGEEGEG